MLASGPSNVIGCDHHCVLASTVNLILVPTWFTLLEEITNRVSSQCASQASPVGHYMNTPGLFFCCLTYNCDLWTHSNFNYTISPLAVSVQGETDLSHTL